MCFVIPVTLASESVALLIQNDPLDPPGYLADWLADDGIELQHIRAYADDKVPADLDGNDALIVLGGPMSAHDHERAPWLPEVIELLRKATTAGTPTLGVCLGAQLLAVATGGYVEPGEDGPELGAGLVAKRDAATFDPVFRELPLTPDVVQWHYDVITDLPPAGLLLAASVRYPHQAFRVGEQAWGMQFHIEATPEMVRGWAEADRLTLAPAGVDVDAIIERAIAVQDDVSAVWRPVVSRFARSVRSAGAAGAES